MSPGEVIAQDLELLEPRDQLNSKFIEDFAKARDDLLSQIKKQNVFCVLVFLFLLSNYLSVGIDINVGGFSLRYGRGIPEGLLLASNLISCYTLILQANTSILDAAIKAAIKLGLPEELRALYLVRYFPHEHFGRYQPFNMPHLIPTKLQRVMGTMVALLFLILLVLTVLGFATCNLFLLVHHLWIKPSFGIWSNALLAYRRSHIIFFATTTMRSRLEIIETLYEIHLKPEHGPAFKKYWNSLESYILKLSQFRNALAHWHPHINICLKSGPEGDVTRYAAALGHPVPGLKMRSIEVQHIVDFIEDCQFASETLSALKPPAKKKPRSLPLIFRTPITRRNKAELQERSTSKASQPRRPPSTPKLSRAQRRKKALKDARKLG